MYFTKSLNLLVAFETDYALIVYTFCNENKIKKIMFEKNQKKNANVTNIVQISKVNILIMSK